MPMVWCHQTSLLAYGLESSVQSCHNQRSHVCAVLFQIYKRHAHVICAFLYIPLGPVRLIEIWLILLFMLIWCESYTSAYANFLWKKNNILRWKVLCKLGKQDWSLSYEMRVFTFHIVSFMLQLVSEDRSWISKFDICSTKMVEVSSFPTSAKNQFSSTS